jgi:DNA-binding transcriptional MocR family regulator
MRLFTDPGVISLARGVPSPDAFPVAQLAECGRRAVEEDGRVALNYGGPGGYEPLRAWIAERHGVTPDRVVVTPGSMIALQLLVRHLVPGPRRVLVEAPTYDRALGALREAGAEVLTVARGEQGLDLERLRELAPGAAFLYVLPTFHNPTGRTLGLSEREQLADLAVEHDLTVVEDDPYGLLRLDGAPLPHVHQLLRERGGGELAIHMSSFSKTVAPGLRVGYLVLPERLVAPVEALATALYISPPLLPQAQLHAFLAAGHLEPQLESLRAFLRPRRDALLATLAGAGLPAAVRWTRPEGGYFLWLELPPGLDAGRFAERAAAAGVAVVPGSGFHADDGGSASVRLAFSFPTVQEIRTGAARLAELLTADAA